MSIVVNWVTSLCKSVVLLQLLINFFPPFFPLKEMKTALIVEGEATPTRSVPLPVEEKEEESEEAREGGIVVVARGCTWLPCSPHHLKLLFKILKWN